MGTREWLGIAVSVSSLLVAAAVVAQQEGSDGKTEAVNVNRVRAQITTAANTVVRVREIYEKAQKAYNEARSANNTKSMECIQEKLAAMRGPHKLAIEAAAAIEEDAKGDLTRKDIAAAIESESIKLASHFETMVTLDGQLAGCGGAGNSGTIDGRPFVEKTAPQVDTKAVDQSGNTNNISDLTVGAENSTVGSVKALSGD